MHTDQLPPMPVDCVAHVGATAQWPFIARAAYRELLIHQWIAGELPADTARLAELIGMPEAAFAIHWPMIAHEFEHTPSGTLINKHTAALRNEVLRVRETYSRRARAAALGRWGARPRADASSIKANASSITPSDASSMQNDASSIRKNASSIRKNASSIADASSIPDASSMRNDASSIENHASSIASSIENVSSIGDASSINGSHITLEVFPSLSEDLNPKIKTGKRARAYAHTREDAFAVPPDHGGNGAAHFASEPNVDPFAPGESWRRDVPEVNAEKFGEWLRDLELRGKPLRPHARLLAARYLAGQGDHAAQAAIVDFCMMQEYKRLIPYADVQREQSTNGTNGSGTRRRYRTRSEATTEMLDRLKQTADEMPGECSL